MRLDFGVALPFDPSFSFSAEVKALLALADSRVLGTLGSLGAGDHATAKLQKAIAQSNEQERIADGDGW